MNMQHILICFSIFIFVSNGQYWTFVGRNQSSEGFSGNFRAIGNFPQTNEIVIAIEDVNMLDGTKVNGLAVWNNSHWLPVLTVGCSNIFAMTSSDSDLYVVGNSQCFNAGVGIAKFNGSSWNPVGSISANGNSANANANLNLIAINSTGNKHIFIAGNNLNSIGSLSVNYIAGFNGTHWYSVGNFNQAPLAMAMDGVGRLLVFGIFTSISALQCNNFARYSGSVWTCIQTTNLGNVSNVGSFASNTNDNSMFFSGAVGQFAGVFRMFQNGTVINLNSVLFPQKIAYSASTNTLYIGSQGTSGSFSHVASFNGTHWNNMLGGIIGIEILGITTDPVGNAYFAGTFSRSTSGVCASGILKWSPTGNAPISSLPVVNSPWKDGFRTNETHNVNGIAYDPTSSIVFAISTRPLYGFSKLITAYDMKENYFVPLNASIASQVVNAIINIPEGFLIGFSANSFGNVLIWKNTDRKFYTIGKTNSSQVGTNGDVYAVARNSSSGFLYVGGLFSQAGGYTNAGIAAFNGTDWISRFGDNISTNGVVYSICFDENKNMYVGGWFSSLNGISNLGNLIRFDGVSWFSLSNGTDNNPVKALAYDPYNSILWIGGFFFSLANGQNVGGITRWNVTSQKFVLTNATLNQQRVQSLYVVGSTPFFGVKSGVLYWNETAFVSITPNLNNEVAAITFFNGTLWVGGTFSRSDVCLSNVARLEITSFNLPNSPIQPTPSNAPSTESSTITTQLSSASDPTLTSSDGNSTSLGLIIGIVVAVLVICCVFIIIVALILYRKRKQQQPQLSGNEMELKQKQQTQTQQESQQPIQNTNYTTMESVEQRTEEKANYQNMEDVENSKSILKNEKNIYNNIEPPDTYQNMDSVSKLPGNNNVETVYANSNFVERAPIDSKSGFRSIKSADLVVSDKKLGQGAFGVVFQGTYKGSIPVAVKEFLPELNLRSNDLLEEAKMMSKLSEHPNVVTLIGVLETPQLKIVTELMSGGNLWFYISSKKNTAQISNQQKLDWCLSVAKGMKFLNGEGIIHRDLAARNVLLDSNLVAKVSDFGLSKAISSKKDSIYYTSAVGPLRWMAPESMEKHKFSEKSDVWSWGVLCFEIFKEQQPYDEIEENLVVASKVMHMGLKPVFPPTTPQIIQNIHGIIFATEPEDRPTFTSIVTLLQTSK